MTEKQQRQIDADVLAAIEKMGMGCARYVQEKRILAALKESYRTADIAWALSRLVVKGDLYAKYRPDRRDGHIVNYYRLRLAPAGRAKD